MLFKGYMRCVVVCVLYSMCYIQCQHLMISVQEN